MVSAGDAVVGGIKYKLNEKTMMAEAAGLADSTITHLVIPASIQVEGKEYQVLSIGDNAFRNNFFSSITFSEGLRTIGTASFMYSWRIKILTIPNSVETIGPCAFENCSLKIFVIGTGIKTIGESAIKSIGLYDEGEVYIYAPQIPEIVPWTADFPDETSWYSVKLYVPADLVEEYRQFKSELPYFYAIKDENILPLPSDTQIEISGLTYNLDKGQNTATLVRVQNYSPAIEIPAYVEVDGERYNVTSIGKRAFALTDSAELKSITLPEGLLRIEEQAFEACGIEDITLPNSVEFIGKAAFCRCRSLRSVRFGESIRTIDNNALSACDNLGAIFFPAKEMPKNVAPLSLNPDPFDENSMDNVFLYVPENLLEAYRSSEELPWSAFKKENIIATDPSTISGIHLFSSTKETYYSLEGHRLTSPQKGINIIRQSDGTTKKIIVK
jgi:hypothetical protein